MSNESVFSEMTNLYSLSKTLRFELKPVGRTLDSMKEHGILQKDEAIEQAYQKIKKLLDALHNDFIAQSLSGVSFERSDFLTFYSGYRNAISKGRVLEPKEKKKWNDGLAKLLNEKRSLFASLYGKTATDRKNNPNWIDKKGKPLLKKNGYNILLESGIVSVLGLIYKGDEEKEKDIQRFAQFSTYLAGYNQNRENYYTVKGNSTEIAYRIVDQNLVTFCNNLLLKSRFDDVGFEFSAKELQLFDINFYNHCLTQEGINTYNAFIGRKSEDEHTKGINQRVNEYNQKLYSGAKKLPKLKQLYKQIGSPKTNTIPFFLINNTQELTELLEQFLDESFQHNQEISRLLDRIIDGDVDYSLIHMTKNNFNYFSNRYFSSWYVLQEVAGELGLFSKAKKSSDEAYIVPAHVSLADLKAIIDELQKRGYSYFKSHWEYEDTLKTQMTDLRQKNSNDRNFLLACVRQDFNKLFSQDELVNEQGKQIRFVGYNAAKSAMENVLPVLDIHNQEHKNIIKRFADASLALLRFVKLFRIADEAVIKDTTFYEDLEQLIKVYPVNKRYDAIRNYLTKKPFSEEKMKLNFDKGNLLTGWPDSPPGNTQYCGHLLRKGGNYYLGISTNTRIFDETRYPDAFAQSDGRERMIYKQLDGKTIYGSIYIGKFGSKYSDDKEKLDNAELITRIKIILQEQKKYFPELSRLIDTEYVDPNKLATDISKENLYILDFVPISGEYISKKINANEKPLYLFEISSKDFYGKSKTKDLQSLYRENVFVGGSTIKLNGGAEVFFRKKSLKKERKHVKVTQDHILKNKRYTEDKVLFHVPITVGFGGKELSPSQCNQYMNQQLIKNKSDISILGIDRGEKHLAFYSVVDLEGQVKKQGTLNIIGGVNYEKKLSDQAVSRLQARQNWETIGNIRNLKEGYISYVVRKIADLMIEHNAIVVFEDLNSGFKRGRQKIEQSVYQKLELALAKKLSFLVNKGTSEGQLGSATNAYQLCPEVNTFGDIKGKQRGAILYTRANYTSTTDPETGWRKNLYLKKGKREDMREAILKFDAFGYDSEKDAFFFTYSPRKFVEGKGTKARTVWSCVDRFRGKKDASSGQWKIDRINVTANLKKIFEEYAFQLSTDILSQLASRKDMTAGFYEQLIWNFDVIMQIRNTGNDERDSDFIHSPVEPFYDSRERKDKCFDESESMLEKPTSGDANGAYNIARKGIMMVERIFANPEKPNLYISDVDRDIWITK